MKNLKLNPYQIKWAVNVNEKNVLDFSKSFFAPNQEMLKEKLKGKKGRFFIITDKQFGLIQNSWSSKPLEKNTNLAIHLEVFSSTGCKSMIPMTKNQFNNPILN